MHWTIGRLNYAFIIMQGHPLLWRGLGRSILHYALNNALRLAYINYLE